MRDSTFTKRQMPNARTARNAAMNAANVDTSGLDPEMAATLGQESARRVGAAGVGVRTRTPGAVEKLIQWGRGAVRAMRGGK